MNAEARIVVRAQFNDTLAKFRELTKILGQLEAVTNRVNNSVFKLSDSMAKNTAEAQAWAAAVARSAEEIGALSNPLNIVAQRLNVLGAAEDKAGLSGMAFGARLRANGTALEAWGKKLQYNGSILTYSFTLPLVAAFYLLTKQELQYQTALTGLRQAYNLVGASTSSVSTHNQALARDYTALQSIIIAVSNAYGINRVQVAQNATELARAGDRSVSLASDLALAEKTQRTYNITNKQAVDLVMQLRTAYGLTAEQAKEAVASLSVIQENSRGTFDVLTAAIQRVAPAARQSGFSIRQLGAMLAVIIQAGYKGGEAGNALSFSLARLLTPTAKASALFKQLGVDVTSSTYQSLPGAARIQLLADKISHLSGAQKDIAAEVIFGQRQYQRMLPVLEDIANKTGLYNQILKDTNNTTANAAFFNRELAQQLKNPATNFAILKTNVQNSFRAIATDLTPAVIGVMRALEGVAQAFSNLSPGTQKVIVMSLAFLALLGPVMKLVGVFGILGGYLLRLAGLFVATEGSVATFAEAAPLLLRFGAPLAIVTLAFQAFGINISTILGKVLEVVAYVAHAIYDLFSWINPWARHSPSLVENVQTGVDQMISDFTRLTFVKGILTDVGATIEKVGAAAARMSGSPGTPTSLLSARRAVAKDKGDTGTFDAGVTQLNRLNAALVTVAHAWDTQKRVVDAAKGAYDGADMKLREAEAGLKRLQSVQKALEADGKKYGNAASLTSQAADMRKMARSILEAGNADLAQQFAQQASVLQDQANKAGAVATKLDDINAQIDTQQSQVDALTASRDELLNTYDAEKAKLDAITQGYAEMKAQATALTQALIGMGQAASSAMAGNKAAKGGGKTDAGIAAFKAAGGAKGLPDLNSILKNSQGDLNKWLADFQKHNGLDIALPDFFKQLSEKWKTGWSAFGHGDAFQAVFGFGKSWPTWLQAASVAGIITALSVISKMMVAGFNRMWAAILLNARVWSAEMVLYVRTVALEWVAKAAWIAAEWAAKFILMSLDAAAWVAKQVTAAAVVVATNVAGAAATAAAWVAANLAMSLGIGALVALVVLAVVEIIKHWKDIEHAATATWNAIKSAASTAWSWIKRYGLDALGAITFFMGGWVILMIRHWTAIKTAAGAAWDWIKTHVSGVAKSILGFFTSLPGQLQGAMLTLGRNIVHWIASGITDAASAVANAVLGVINKIPGVGLLKKGLNAVSTVAGGAVNDVKNLLNGHLAAGGIAQARGLYLVGEHGPELLQMGNMAGYVHTAQRTNALLNAYRSSATAGGSTHVVNQNINVTLNETQNTDPHHVAAHIAWASRTGVSF